MADASGSRRGRALLRGRLRPVALGLLLSLAPSAARPQPPDRELEELLDLGLAELGEIEVTTASKREESIADAPATVRMITEEQIRERGYLTLEQALADLPGMQLRNTLGLNSYVFVRGVPNQNNLALVLVDGVEINELNSGGFYGGGQYNLSNVKRIEVVYGPTSALYGTNAVSGVINVITKDPQDSPGLRAGGAAGSYDTARGDLQYAFWDPETRFGLRVSGMLWTTAHADLAGAKGGDLWTPELELFERDRALDVKITYRDLVFGANYQGRASSSSTLYRSVGTVGGTTYRDHGTLWDIRFLNAYLRHRVTLADGVVLQSEVYAREATVLDDSVREITDLAQFGYYRPNYLLGAEALIDARLGRDLRMTGGLVLETDWLARSYGTSQSGSPDERPPRPPRPDLTDNQLVSSYLQAQYAPIERVELTAGFRFDFSSAYRAVLTPRAGVVVRKDALVAKLLYGEAFRAPKPWDYTYGLGNDHLDPERMRSVELSVGWSWRKLLRVEGAAYWNRLDDVLGKEIVGTPDESRWVNAGHVQTLGAELGAEARRGALRGFASYTFTRSRDQADAPVPEIAQHGAILGVGYRLSPRIRATVWGQYLGARTNPKVIAATGDDRIDPALLLNASIAFLDLAGFDFRVHARNLLDEVYYHPSNLDPDRFRQPGRTALVEAAYRF